VLWDNVAANGISGTPEDQFRPTNWGKKADLGAALKIANDAHKVTVGKTPSTPEEITNYVAFIQDNLNVQGLDVPANLEQTLLANLMTDEELMVVANGLASSAGVNVDDVYNYLKLEYDSNGRAGVNNIAKDFRKGSIQQAIETNKQEETLARQIALEEAKESAAAAAAQTPASIKAMNTALGTDVTLPANRLNNQYGVLINDDVLLELDEFKKNLVSVYDKGVTDTDVADLFMLNNIIESGTLVPK
jgi:hypothetical protein